MTDQDIQDVYNFERAFEPAIGACFVDQGLTVYTSFGKLLEDGSVDTSPEGMVPVFQRARPHIEVSLFVGAGRGQRSILDNQPYDESWECAWTANVRIDVVTDIAPAPHTNLVAVCRYVASRLPALVNGTRLLKHKLQHPIRHMGESHSEVAAEKAYWLTTLNYAFEFSVQTDAWAPFAP